MRMTLDELTDFASLRYLKDLLPMNVKVDIHFHSEQSRGPATEGPWSSCTLKCVGFASLEAANAFWAKIKKKVGIGPNSVRPHKPTKAKTWQLEIFLQRSAAAKLFVPAW